MANIAIFRINYKSDFILTLNSDAGWMTPFCIKFWTGAPSQAYFAGFDGTTYTHCAPVAGEPTKLQVQFDDHHLPIGDLKFQIGYHFTVADFPTSVEDEVINQASVVIEVDDAPAQVMLDFNGETAPEIEFSLPAYANEAQRIANEEQRIANEQSRVLNESRRIEAEEQRIANEQQRIDQETVRVNEFARLKRESEQATTDANAAATLANEKAALAADKAELADDAATLANAKAQLAADKAALADDAATLANDKADYAQTQGDYAKAQGDYAKQQGEIAEDDHERAEADHTRAESDHATAGTDHTQAGTDHTRAESDHATAAADHTQAGADHTRAESDHAQSTSDHTQAGTDHTRAESDHATASADHTQAGQDHTRAESDHTRAESDHAAVEVYVDSLGAFDISAYHATGGVLAKYADLTAALGTNGANIPEGIRKGGMSVKFVQSSDNKYVQYRLTTEEFSTDVEDWEEAGKGDVSKEDLENGNIVPLYAKTLEDWADQKAIATPDTYTDAVRTTGGDIPVETSAGSKPESIKPVAGSKWTAKLLFNGSYNMLNAAKWGSANSQPYVGGVGNDFVYFLVPELTLGTFGTADENNGLLFTDSEGENVEPTSVYYKPLGATVPQSLTDGTSVTPTSVSYDGNTYKDYVTDGAGWLIIPKTYYDNDVCAHIAWEDWYDKYVSLDEPTTNPEAVVGVLMLEGLLALAHSDKYLRGVNNEVCDNVVFGDTSATITHMVDELSVAANAWTNAATGESDSQGNALYRHSATVSLIKQGGAACVEGEDGGIPLTVNGTTVSYIDTNAAAPASVVFYEVTATSTTKAYTDSVFSGSNINTETGVLPINDCSIEAQVAMDGQADITVKYAKNIVDQVAINATVDVPQIKKQVEEHEERIEELEDTAVRTGSYDASVSVGLADNLRGDTVVSAEFYKRKTGGTQSVGSGIAAIKEVRGKSIVWNQLVGINASDGSKVKNGVTITDNRNGTYTISTDENGATAQTYFNISTVGNIISGHKYYIKGCPAGGSPSTYMMLAYASRITGADYGGGLIKEAISTGIDYAAIVVQNGAVITTPIVFNPQWFDLTLMFGAGNEPATVEEFKKMFPLAYYDYNAGEVIPFAGQNLVTTGFNQWDEQWENGALNITTGKPSASATSIRAKNMIPVLPNTTYYCKANFAFIGDGIWTAFFDAAGKIITSGITITAPDAGNLWNIKNTSFTTNSQTAFIRFYLSGGYGQTYKNDICINISNPDRNGTYEPYEKHTLPLDPSQWRDKNGELVFPYGGMHGVGTAYDYAKVDADGYIRKAVRVFEQVNLGNLTWTYNNRFETTDLTGLFKKTNDNSKIPNFICSKYEVISRSILATNDKCVTTTSDGGSVDIKDSSYSDAATFKAAMQGVSFIYELAEPVEVELSTPVYAKYLCDKDGTEEITPVNGTTPYTTMANLSILYAMDARGEIKNLPKNYLSKESAENMLNAMVSAGVIASYTMTWDAANNRYAFTIVAPAQSNE